MPGGFESGRGEVDDLTGLAVALTGDARTAASLLGEVQELDRARSPEEAPGDRRALLVHRFLRSEAGRSNRPARWRHRHRSGRLGRAEQSGNRPDHADLPPELARVLQQVDRLDALPRAVLVLRHHEHLMLAELATLMDRPVATVARVLAEAEQAAGAEPFELAVALRSLPATDRAAVDVAARRFRQERRRRRGRLLVTATAALVLTVAVSVVPGALERRSTFVRPYGAWVHGFDLESNAGWQAGGRTLTAGRDSLSVYNATDARRSCLVDVLASPTPLTVPDGRRTRIQGRTATVVQSNGSAPPYLWWSLGPASAAVIGCSDGASEEVLFDLANHVRLREVPLRLPFDVTALGDDYEVRFVSTQERAVLALTLPAGEVSRSRTNVYLSVPGSDRIPEDRQRSSAITVSGLPGSLSRGRNGGMALCWPVQSSGACLSAYVFRESSDPGQHRLRTRLTGMAEGLRFAPRIEDPATWVDAREMLPR